MYNVDINFDNMNFMKYQRDEHRVHLIGYHLAWTLKRLNPILVEQVAEDCKFLIEQKCNQRGWKILELAVRPDHVYLFVRAYPSDSAAEIIKECKGLTSHELRKKYPELKRKLPSLWTRSYFASTAEDVSQDTIRRYIETQRGL